MAAKEIFRLVAGVWRATGPVNVTPTPPVLTGRVTKVRSASTFTAPVDPVSIEKARRDALGPYGSYKPAYTDTGNITPRDQLTAFNSPSTTTFTLTSAHNGVTFKSQIIYGQILRASGFTGCTFDDCWIAGPPSPGIANDTALMQFHNDYGTTGATTPGAVPAFTTTLIDCTIQPQFPNFYSDAIAGRNYICHRVKTFWCNDSYGPFTNSGTQPTNVEIAGCWIGPTVYWHGAWYVNDGSVGWNGSSYSGTPIQRPASDPPIYSIKTDGTHNDGIEIQGGYGRMIWNATTQTWSGNGIHIYGNSINPWDADQQDVHPEILYGGFTAGPFYAMPDLGTQDGGKRAPQNPANGNPTPPVTNGWRMPSGHYAPNGQAIVIPLNVNTLPYIDTVVIHNNWIDNYQSAFNLQSHGSASTSEQVTIYDNRIGSNVYEFSRGSGSGSSTYPIRIYGYESSMFLESADSVNPVYTTVGGSGQTDGQVSSVNGKIIRLEGPDMFLGRHPITGAPNITTNVWDDPANRWGIYNSPLTVGRHSGIQNTPTY